MNRDYLGNVINVGDEVVFMQVGYRSLMKGRIASLGKAKATIEHEPTNTCKTRSIQFYNQMVKIN